MATAYLRAESAPVILPHKFAQAAAVMAQFDRAQIASAVEVLVNLLDVLDGDTDLEGEWSEDEISSTPTWITLADGPGCQISDAGGQCDEDDNNTDLGRTLDAKGPGCELSDPDCAADDIGCDDNELDLDEGYYDTQQPIPGGGSGDC